MKRVVTECKKERQTKTLSGIVRISSIQLMADYSNPPYHNRLLSTIQYYTTFCNISILMAVTLLSMIKITDVLQGNVTARLF